MAKISSQNIRNVCLLGHSASGKTSITEAMLYLTKGSDRLGTVTDGNTVCDFDPELKPGLCMLEFHRNGSRTIRGFLVIGIGEYDIILCPVFKNIEDDTL